MFLINSQLNFWQRKLKPYYSTIHNNYTYKQYIRHCKHAMFSIYFHTQALNHTITQLTHGVSQNVDVEKLSVTSPRMAPSSIIITSPIWLTLVSHVMLNLHKCHAIRKARLIIVWVIPILLPWLCVSHPRQLHNQLI